MSWSITPMLSALWRGVTNALDLRSNDTVCVILEALKATGHITFTTKEHSLDVVV